MSEIGNSDGESEEPRCEVCNTSPAKRNFRDRNLGSECYLSARSEMAMCKGPEQLEGWKDEFDNSFDDAKADIFAGRRNNQGKRSHASKTMIKKKIQDDLNFVPLYVPWFLFGRFQLVRSTRPLNRTSLIDFV